MEPRLAFGELPRALRDPLLQRGVQLAQRRFGPRPLDSGPRAAGDLADEGEFVRAPFARGGVVEVEQGDDAALLGHRHVDD